MYTYPCTRDSISSLRWGRKGFCVYVGVKGAPSVVNLQENEWMFVTVDFAKMRLGNQSMKIHSRFVPTVD